MTKCLWCRRPETYKEWRRLWHALAKDLGFHINWCIRQGEPLLNRYTWKLSRQMDRVWLRLRVEEEAGHAELLAGVCRDGLSRNEGR